MSSLVWYSSTWRCQLVYFVQEESARVSRVLEKYSGTRLSRIVCKWSTTGLDIAAFWSAEGMMTSNKVLYCPLFNCWAWIGGSKSKLRVGSPEWHWLWWTCIEDLLKTPSQIGHFTHPWISGKPLSCKIRPLIVGILSASFHSFATARIVFWSTWWWSCLWLSEKCLATDLGSNTHLHSLQNMSRSLAWMKRPRGWRCGWNKRSEWGFLCDVKICFLTGNHWQYLQNLVL